MFYEKMKKQIDSVQMKTTDHHLASGGPKNGPHLGSGGPKTDHHLANFFSDLLRSRCILSLNFVGIVTFEMHFITKIFFGIATFEMHFIIKILFMGEKKIFILFF